MDPTQTFPFAEFTIAMGFFVLLTIEQIITDARERRREMSSIEAQPILEDGGSSGVVAANDSSETERHNQNASIRAFAMTFALSIHSIFEGIAIGVQSTAEDVLQVCRLYIYITIRCSFISTSTKMCI